MEKLGLMWPFNSSQLRDLLLATILEHLFQSSFNNCRGVFIIAAHATRLIVSIPT